MSAGPGIYLTRNPVIDRIEFSLHVRRIEIEIDTHPVAAHRLVMDLALSVAAIGRRIVEVTNLASGLLVLIVSTQAISEDLDLVTVGVLDALDTAALRDSCSVRQINSPVIEAGDRGVEKTAIVGVVPHRSVGE